MQKEHAVAVLLVTPQGIPLIRDPKKPRPIFWKLPGGRGSVAETASGCAVRELKEELGASVVEEDLKVIYEEDKGSHILTIFRLDLPTIPRMKPRGNEGEEIGVFSPRDILAKQDFFPNHRKVVETILASLP